MIPLARLLRPIEAAAVADVSLRDVNRMIDDRLLPDMFIVTHDGRAVAASACALIAFYFQTEDDLTSRFRDEILRLASNKIHDIHFDIYTHDIKFSNSISINLHKYYNNTERRLHMLDDARDLIVADPETLGGTPVIRHTRVPVYDVAASIVAGHSRPAILAAYPSLTPDMLDLVEIYVRANPAREHVRNEASPHPGTEIRIPRRRAAGA